MRRTHPYITDTSVAVNVFPRPLLVRRKSCSPSRWRILGTVRPCWGISVLASSKHHSRLGLLALLQNPPGTSLLDDLRAVLYSNDCIFKLFRLHYDIHLLSGELSGFLRPYSQSANGPNDRTTDGSIRNSALAGENCRQAATLTRG